MLQTPSGPSIQGIKERAVVASVLPSPRNSTQAWSQVGLDLNPSSATPLLCILKQATCSL